MEGTPPPCVIKEAIHISPRDPVELLYRDQGLDIDSCRKNLARRPLERQQNREQSRGEEPRLRRRLDMCRCAYYLARSLSDLLSVYSDDGHSIVVETSVKDLL